MKIKPTVAIIYKSMPQYRQEFFNLLKLSLDELGIDLRLIYGQADDNDLSKRDRVDIPWAIKIQNKIISIGPKTLYWQPCLQYLKDADLVVVEQANKLLINYILIVQNVLKYRRLAFWGHGRDFQKAKNNILEVFKKHLSKRVYWWFAYNNLSAEIIKSYGFPENRITSVQNAIDTKKLIEIQKEIKNDDINKIKNELGIVGENICIYCGGLYKEKCIDFLIESSLKIKSQIKDFQVIIIGAGPEQDKVRHYSELYNWIHYVGPKFGKEKVVYFTLSKLNLLPGVVGLSILDSFALGIPLVTTSLQAHGPEIDYIKNGQNGLIVSHDVNDYTKNVVELLRNESFRGKLVSGCLSSRTEYTVEDMVYRFKLGIVNALNLEDKNIVNT